MFVTFAFNFSKLIIYFLTCCDPECRLISFCSLFSFILIFSFCMELLHVSVRFWFGLCDFRFSWSAGQSSYTPYRDYLSRSGYKPYYQRQQELSQQKEQERDGRSNSRINRPASTISAISPSSSSSSVSPSPLTSTTTATTTVVTTSTTTNSVFRRCWKWTCYCFIELWL